MTLSHIDKMFIKKWKQLDFTEWNESDVREEFIAPLLSILGYSKGTISNILREESVNLSDAYHRIGRTRVKIDYIPTIRLHKFWIIEAKPGTPKEMTFGDFLQAHLYAIHPEVHATYFVLCNGWEIRVYEAETANTWDDALLICQRDDASGSFAELKNLLGRESLSVKLRERLLDTIEASLAVEIDLKQVDLLEKEVNRIALTSKARIRNNARELEIGAWREYQKQLKEEREQASESQLFTMMDIPTYALTAVGEEFVRRVVGANPDEQSRLLDKLATRYRARPHTVFRVHSSYVCCKLLDKGIIGKKTEYIISVAGCLKELVENNMNYWSSNPLANAICHLDNATLRLARKICIRFAMEPLKALVEAQKQTLAPEDILTTRPSVGKEMVGIVSLVAEKLWRMYCSKSSADEIWGGIWKMEVVENHLDQIPALKYPTGDGDLLFFDHYGRGFDMLCAGTWDVVSHNLPSHPDTPKVAKDLAIRTRDSVLANIPKPQTKPQGWHEISSPVLDALIQAAKSFQQEGA